MSSVAASADRDSLTSCLYRGHTPRMKTAIWMPYKVDRAAERLAKRKCISRSERYGRAVEALIRVEDQDAVTAQRNRVYAADPGDLHDVLRRRPGRAHLGEPWESTNGAASGGRTCPVLRARVLAADVPSSSCKVMPSTLARSPRRSSPS